jgi:hypothetical protein
MSRHCRRAKGVCWTAFDCADCSVCDNQKSAVLRRAFRLKSLSLSLCAGLFSRSLLCVSTVCGRPMGCTTERSTASRFVLLLLLLLLLFFFFFFFFFPVSYVHRSVMPAGFRYIDPIRVIRTGKKVFLDLLMSGTVAWNLQASLMLC